MKKSLLPVAALALTSRAQLPPEPEGLPRKGHLLALTDGEKLVSIDFRVERGSFYALSLDLAGGQASFIGTVADGAPLRGLAVEA